MSTTKRVTAKTIVSAIALAGGLAVAAPAAADPSAIGIDPSPFGTLGCNCRAPLPAGSPDSKQEINRGIREGLSVSVPGLPPPDRH
jgi:hypothetical protein